MRIHTSTLGIICSIEASNDCYNVIVCCYSLGVNLIEEHLREVRCLRQRLEESIKTNERLRQQLEERLATTGRDGGTEAERCRVM